MNNLNTQETVTPWTAFKVIFTGLATASVSLTNVVVDGSQLLSDTVNIASNEVASIEEAQQIRLDEIKAERADKRKAREAA